MIAGVACAATQTTIHTPIPIGDGGNDDKPKVQRGDDGTLVVVYGDSPDGAGDPGRGALSRGNYARPPPVGGSAAAWRDALPGTLSFC
jgi:hypothetical protein